ncbi:MAG: endonuclease MutS2 [Clostridiales bacterium]|nr:endonuclease MutS2 [Clostridiales bacterium]MDY5513870.1 endonuclease MutS2 [Candidatus Ventricola sp.]
MTERSLRVLEFGKIRDQLAQYCVSDMGRELCDALTPAGQMDDVLRWQQETEEARTVLTYLGGTPMISFSDVRAPLHLAEIGSALSPRALLDIAACLRASRAARDALVGERDNTPMITANASRLSTFKPIEQAITDAILSEDEIADRASTELFTIRRKMRACNERVRERLNGMIHNASFQKYLQEAIITMRADRYVLPVKQEYRGMVPGIVHDQSSTGATIFVEPMAVVEIGNELKQLISAEKAEIERILRALSAQIAPEAGAIAGNLAILAQLDFAFAKAALAREMHACPPKMNGEGRINIIRGRHPLIDPEKVVPLDIRLGETFTTLIITGPNTGGKTVTLKTTGLFTLMAQAGLQVPAEYGTELAVFDDVFADIGDEQSIEQSLSTFSGHMKNIVSILENVTPDSLVLFDELGAGTDPTEGAALAQAILATLLTMHTRTVATTHYSELKEYALTTENVENASVEFDVATLRPTYRLSIGIPGKSNAFEISRKLGLPEFVINSAKELLSREQVRFEDVIAGAEYHRQVAEKERQLAEEARAEMVAIRNQAEAERKKLEEQRDKAIRKAKDEAKRIVENARRESEAMIAELRAMKKAGGAQEHEIQRVKKQMEQAQEALADQKEVGGEIPKSVKPGDMVHVASMELDATVVSGPDAKGYVQLKAGMMKMRAQMSDLRTLTSTQQLIKKEQKKLERKRSMREQRVDVMARAVRQELDVRGMALDEAIPEVQKFIDDAVISSLGEVSIIHGNGMGVLRAGIADCLKRHPSVSSFRLGRYGEGETGVTIVTLR